MRSRGYNLRDLTTLIASCAFHTTHNCLRYWQWQTHREQTIAVCVVDLNEVTKTELVTFLHTIKYLHQSTSFIVITENNSLHYNFFVVSLSAMHLKTACIIKIMRESLMASHTARHLVPIPTKDKHVE